MGGWFVVLLLVPALAYMGGNRSENIDLRQFEAWPGVPVDHALDSRYYRSLDRFLTDRSPIRDEAIQAKGEVTIKFSTVVNGVINGQDGWRFYVEELTPACSAQFGPDAIAATIRRVHQQLQDRGIDNVFALTPDKFTIMGDKVPAGTKDLHCAVEAHQTLRGSLNYGPGSEAVDLWSLLARKRAADPAQLFWKDDTHLTAEGRTEVVRAVVEALAPGTFDDRSVVKVTDVNVYSDLARLQGISTTERVAAHAIERPDIELVTISEFQPAGPNEVIVSYGTSGSGTGRPAEGGSPRGRVIPGNTVVIYDSQFGVEVGRQAQMATWFERSTFIHWNLLSTPQATEALAQADHVVVQSVQRYAHKIPAQLPDAIAAAFP